jgi:hypothetical protein
MGLWEDSFPHWEDGGHTWLNNEGMRKLDSLLKTKGLNICKHFGNLFSRQIIRALKSEMRTPSLTVVA